ncbi:hypothetical protein KA043_03730 [Candidatus Saccharibacteria bacterium]|jgi:hypothetical protein|nr:hypothetical protein [Candidatus Saccharibacteria bacterium]
MNDEPRSINSRILSSEISEDETEARVYIGEQDTYNDLAATIIFFQLQEEKRQQTKQKLLKWFVEKTDFLQNRIIEYIDSSSGENKSILFTSCQDYQTFVEAFELATNQSINDSTELILELAVNSGLLANITIRLDIQNEFASVTDESIAREMAKLAEKYSQE